MEENFNPGFDKNLVKLMLGKYLKEFINAVLAGVLVSLGAFIYVIASSFSQQVLGGVLSSLGFILIMLYGYSLFGGKLTFAFENKPIYFIEILIAIIGNYLGTFIVSAIALLTRFCDKDNATYVDQFTTKLNSLVEVTLNESVLSLIAMAFFCGILIYFAFNTYKKSEMALARMGIVLLCVLTFTFCGFNHVVSDMFYMNLYSMVNGFSNYGILFGKVMYVFLGNMLGTLFVPFIRFLRAKVKSI